MKMSDYKLTNYYETMNKKFKPQQQSYPNYDTIKINIPFRACFVGPSGSGKTSVLLNLIQAVAHFDSIYLFCKETEEPLYKYLKAMCDNVSKKIKREYLTVSNDLSQVPPVDSFDSKENTLVIFDDWINTPEKQLSTVIDMFIRGRKRNISVAWLSQNYFGIPLKIRQNTSYLFIKKINTSRDLNLILKDIGGDKTKDQLQTMYNHAIAGDFLNFFLIDLNTMNSKLRYRKNFAPLE